MPSKHDDVKITMQNCRNFSVNKVTCEILLPLVAVMLLIASALIMLLVARGGTTVSLPFTLVVSVCWVLIAIMFIHRSRSCSLFEHRMYLITEDGITFAVKKDVIYIPWSELYSVSIVAFNATANLVDYQLVICCIFRSDIADFEHRILRGYSYAVKSMNAFAIIDYSSDVLEEIKRYFPKDIQDLRKKQIYGSSSETLL